MGLKTISQIERSLSARYARVWVDELLAPNEARWPISVRVGRPSQQDLERDFAAWDAEARAIGRWAKTHGLACVYEKRRVGRRSYGFLSHVQAADLVTLASAVGRQVHLATYAARSDELRRRFSQVEFASLRRVLVDMNKAKMTDVDFELLCRASEWFSTHNVRDMTAREVPLEGFHAKWLDSSGHRSMVCALAQVELLDFRERPRVVRFCYLDPAYLAQGGRVHDSWVEGDCMEPAYAPTTVIICENRDSALWFRQVRGGIAIQGDGMAGASVVGQIPWVASAQSVYYWGDIDQHGFQILSKYRENGLRVQSLLMDARTYKQYERFGTYTDKSGRELGPRPQAYELAGLNSDENDLYLRLCSPDFTGPRRIEQERIPLEVAQRLVSP